MTQQTLALLAACALLGCADERPGQQDFDLTRAQDRAMFRPHGMSFKGVVGPYAVYHVTGATPRLAGPNVARAGGGASLLTGARYFTTNTKAGPVTLVLRSGSHPLIGTTIQPAAMGDCIPPDTASGDPGGSTGGEIGGASGGGGGTDTGGGGSGTDTGGSGGGSGSGGGGGDAPCDMSHHEVTVDVDDAPMDAVVLIGRFSISTHNAANNAQALSGVCCTGDDCSDGEWVPPPPK